MSRCAALALLAFWLGSALAQSLEVVPLRHRSAEQVQTVDGARACIHLGQSLSVAFRQPAMTPRGPVAAEHAVTRDVGTGFDAVPHVAGDTVTLEISPSAEAPGAATGSAGTQRLSTTVAGRLGEWILLGGVTAEAAEGGARYSTRSRPDSGQWWVKVEELP